MVLTLLMAPIHVNYGNVSESTESSSLEFFQVSVYLFLSICLCHSISNVYIAIKISTSPKWVFPNRWKYLLSVLQVVGHSAHESEGDELLKVIWSYPAWHAFALQTVRWITNISTVLCSSICRSDFTFSHTIHFLAEHIHILWRSKWVDLIMQRGCGPAADQHPPCRR